MAETGVVTPGLPEAPGRVLTRPRPTRPLIRAAVERRTGRRVRGYRCATWSQAYLAHYPTFEEYVKATEGLHITKAQEKVRHAIIYDAIGQLSCCPIPGGG